VWEREAVRRVRGWISSAWSLLLFKAIVILLFIVACLLQPFFLSIVVAVALSLVWAECEPMRCFRQSLAILLALLATYHFGCLVMSWVARYHPFDEASAFTLPALCLAFFCLHLRELPHLHSGLAVVAVAVAAYLFLFCWHAVHRLVYAAAALSVCTLLDMLASLVQRGCGAGLSLPTAPFERLWHHRRTGIHELPLTEEDCADDEPHYSQAQQLHPL
jgi:hypothetical protein